MVVLCVALVGGVSGKRVIKEGAEEQGRLCALERRKNEGAPGAPGRKTP